MKLYVIFIYFIFAFQISFNKYILFGGGGGTTLMVNLTCTDTRHNVVLFILHDVNIHMIFFKKKNVSDYSELPQKLLGC